jgi:hypothetical protein
MPAKGPALTRRIKFVLVLVLVLVLEKCGWASELLEYCAKSELHPHSGLEMLKGRLNSTCVQHDNMLLYLCGTVALAFDYSYRLFDEGSATQSHVSG